MVSTVPSFEDLYRTYLAYVYGVIRTVAYGLGPEQVEDLAQETFLKAWKAYHQVEVTNIKGWLARIACNATIDMLRREQRYQRYICSLNEEADEYLPDEHEPARSVYSGESELIRQVFEHLHQEERVLLAHMFYQWSQVEIADHLGINYHTCCRKVHVAKRHFREQYRVCSE